MVNGDTCSAEALALEPPGTNLEEVGEDFLTKGDENLVTALTQW
jgi:hypothetical protein